MPLTVGIAIMQRRIRSDSDLNRLDCLGFLALPV